MWSAGNQLSLMSLLLLSLLLLLLLHETYTFHFGTPFDHIMGGNMSAFLFLSFNEQSRNQTYSVTFPSKWLKVSKNINKY